jgi:fatty-acyl-CoA synthase
MIVSGGENVFPKEVEDVLASHPAVAEAAAIGVEDEKFGQRLRAFVVLRDGQEASEEDLQNHVRSNLARYKTPREVLFVRALPRNSTGKVLKRELAERSEEGDSGQDDAGNGHNGADNASNDSDTAHESGAGAQGPKAREGAAKS